jgi:hypothetical protein
LSLLVAGLGTAALISVVLFKAPARIATPKAQAGKDAGRQEVPAALARKLATMTAVAPSTISLLDDDAGGAADQDWTEHAIPGTDIPLAAFTGARADWTVLKARPAKGGGPWAPLGPTYGKGAPNPYRDRSVYNAGTDNFGGRTIDAVIDPNCSTAGCTLWIANANGGVWRTANALATTPQWEFVSQTFEHNSVAALALDPNDAAVKTLWAGTGEPNACGSGCEAGVGLYLTKNGGGSWTGPIGGAQFQARAVGSIAVQPGNSEVVFAASGRGVRGVSNTCCGGADALIPGAPHFGLWRSKDGGKSWQLVNQGADTLCTDLNPDVYSLGGAPCSPRGARRVKFDPVDPNVVYVSFFARGIWRSGDLGNTWERIMAPLGGGNNERAEFDVVALPNGETRMYVGVGGGAGQFARFRRNDAVRNPAAAAVAAAWLDLTSSTANTPGYSSFGYCDPQCWYDNYVHVPAGADPDTVYLSGDNEYTENNNITGRSNGRAVLLSTNAGVSFTDLTEDDRDDVFPGALHPDHHALVTNPNNWKQFFDFGDGGVSRSNGVFVDDSGDCAAPPKSYTGARLAFCQLVLSRVPQRLDAINKGLRTLHFYEIEYNKSNPNTIAGGTQDNGSWETLGDRNTWININVADGGHNAYDAAGGDPAFKMTGWQSGQIEVSFTPQSQVDITWISDTLFVFYGNEGVQFIGNAITDRVTVGRLWTGREHVFRADNHGLNPAFTKPVVLQHCNVWFGDGDLDEDGRFEPATDICDDWHPLGDPGPGGRLTAAGFGDRAGGSVAAVERGPNDTSTLWAATSTGRIFISRNADDASPAAVQFVRLDSLATNDPPRYPTAIFVDSSDANHAWITYSGFNAKTPQTPGHVFEVRYVPPSGAQAATATFTSLDGQQTNGYGDLPANSIIVSQAGTIYVGNDFGVVAKEKGSSVWRLAAAGLPNVDVADLLYVPEKGLLYAATHGQGVWQLKTQ